MICRTRNDEHCASGTPKSSRLLQSVRVISAFWITHRERYKAREAGERRHAIWLHRQRIHNNKLKMLHKIHDWRKESIPLKRKLDSMLRMHRAQPKSVTALHWAKAVKGKRKKLLFMYGWQYPRHKWPRSLPYLNLIALRNYLVERKAFKAKRARGALALSIEEQIRQLELSTLQAENQLDCLKRSRKHPWSVSYRRWLDVTKGTDVAEKDMTIKCYVELARRRDAGEPCDGWAFGRYFGPYGLG